MADILGLTRSHVPYSEINPVVGSIPGGGIVAGTIGFFWPIFVAAGVVWLALRPFIAHRKCYPSRVTTLYVASLLSISALGLTPTARHFWFYLENR